MKRHVWFLVIPLLLVAAGCATAPGGGLAQGEKFALRSTDPRIGVVRNWGGRHLTCRVRDESGRPVDLRNRITFVARESRVLTAGEGDDLLVTVDAHGGTDYLWYVRPAALPMDLPAGLGTMYVNNARHPSIYLVHLEPGRYSIECIPFHVRFWVFSGRERVDGHRQAAGFSVGTNPLAVYDSRSGRHWGWTLSLNGGDPPRNGGMLGTSVQITIGGR